MKGVDNNIYENVFRKKFVKAISSVDERLPRYTEREILDIVDYASEKKNGNKGMVKLAVAAILVVLISGGMLLGGIYYYQYRDKKMIIASYTEELVDSIFSEPVMQNVEYSYIDEQLSGLGNISSYLGDDGKSDFWDTSGFDAFGLGVTGF